MYSKQNQFVDINTFNQLCEQLKSLLLQSKKHPLVIDSRKIINGAVFCAYPGVASDGRRFITQAIQNGAVHTIYEKSTELSFDIANSTPVNYLMHYVGLLAAYQQNNPSQELSVIAITGTNGKTTISHWLNQAFNFLNLSTAIIGTTGCGIYPNVNDYAATTPDPITLQKLVREFADKKVDVLAMEVSSHALDQGRVNGMVFKTAIFTNLTQDHLDYHKTMANYFAAKQQLFYWETLKNAIINADDEYGKLLINDLKQNNSKLNLISYGITNGDLQAQNIEISLQGMKFDLCYNQEKLAVSAPILGRFNVYNLLAVFATLLAHGVKWSELAIIAANLRSVVGRMDAQIILKKPLVVVDYAHTPDALEKALQTLAEIPHNKLICVFGCGGDRDREKRSIMGGIATRIADYSIITTDNPRTETPMGIIDDIVAGVKVNANYTIVEDRLQAIELAIMNAAANDIILVAGKGHENYQEINGVKHYFSDLESVSKILDGYSK